MASGLVYVGRIQNLLPIDGADRIESAEVVCGDGGKWRGVVQKGAFAPGDTCITYLQDALVKPCEELKFLEKTQWRVKMQKFRGSPSECVIMPIKPETFDYVTLDPPVGLDVTEHFGVEKYERPLPTSLGGDALGHFPSFIPKTDEPNFQTARNLVEALRGQPWYATVKCDGSSSTAYRRGEHFGVCSRNLELQEWADNAFWKVALKYNLKETLPDGLALQWETCGPGIQGNPLGLKEIDGFAFNLWDIKYGRYCHVEEFRQICDRIGFPVARVVEFGDAFNFTDDELRKMAEGTYPNGKPREGIVIRASNEQWVMHKHAKHRLSFKVISLAYNN